ncbi:ankyrin repeat domain-containing protein [Paenibacillus sp. FSL R5-0517]|uniref:ankyrin repeat domain-containing protein n=1 Tax=Paenibacillus sp. FSL R5-0517 TaxID=2921647 RepID=UPI0030DB30EA
MLIQQSFIEACQNNDTLKCTMLFSIYVNEIFQEPPFIFECVALGNVQTIQLMLNNGLNPNLCDFEGISLLHLCWLLDKSDEVSVLLDYGADPKQLNIYGKTPFMTALRAGEIPTSLER